MKRITLLSAALFIVVTFVTGAMAEDSVSRGKVLFNDPNFASGQRPCSMCHPAGKGLGNAGGKKEFHVGGGTQKSLEEAVNACIVYASGGKAIDEKSQQMQDIVAYIRSLKKPE